MQCYLLLSRLDTSVVMESSEPVAATVIIGSIIIDVHSLHQFGIPKIITSTVHCGNHLGFVMAIRWSMRAGGAPFASVIGANGGRTVLTVVFLVIRAQISPHRPQPGSSQHQRHVQLDDPRQGLSVDSCHTWVEWPQSPSCASIAVYTPRGDHM